MRLDGTVHCMAPSLVARREVLRRVFCLTKSSSLRGVRQSDSLCVPPRVAALLREEQRRKLREHKALGNSRSHSASRLRRAPTHESNSRSIVPGCLPDGYRVQGWLPAYRMGAPPPSPVHTRPVVCAEQRALKMCPLRWLQASHASRASRAIRPIRAVAEPGSQRAWAKP